jgi:hypothetical protein
MRHHRRPTPAGVPTPTHRSPSGRDRSARLGARPAPRPATPRSTPPAGRAGCPRSGRPASGPRSDARTGSPAPREVRASSLRAAGHGRRGCRRPRPPGPGWSSRTRPCSPQFGRLAPRCGCAGCVRTGAAGRSARARSGRQARPARRSAVRRSMAAGSFRSRDGPARRQAPRSAALFVAIPALALDHRDDRGADRDHGQHQIEDRRRMLGELGHQQRLNSWSRLMRCSSGLPLQALAPGGANFVRRVRRVRRPVRTPERSSPAVLRLTAGPTATVGANLGCDGVQRQVRTRRSPKSKGFRGFRRVQCEPKCDGCDG